ncbi:zinc-dependent alcohol dehydrogenase family protein [Estrella lausannensis]|uniref:Zinc-binding alcohol dehydrogenase family protein n=1 Tax=Estrella lausannensis TaxID=483423 RepID=A0A0H5DPI3_9BACT|nr:zinc-dependent alcohol dehydrogenase family protein [Estrella lausannensis]CRX38357.1 zinc-binding alcohol dehydrogenase family protein [Estrella lausannensis]
MQAAIFETPGKPLQVREMPIPTIKDGELLLQVEACGLCRTDLHILQGELIPPHTPLIPGHQIVGIVKESSSKSRFKKGERVGVGWLGKTCANCYFCQNNLENLCDTPELTGYSIHGGLAEFAKVHEDFAFPLPQDIEAVKLAPLLCPGLIGYRAYKMCKEVRTIGFFGFGASAHLLIQVAISEGRRVFAFVKPEGKQKAIDAQELGASWTGTSDDFPPEPLDAIIIFAPLGDLVPKALMRVRKGGAVILAGIHMSDIPSFPYRVIFEEKSLKSVANLTRKESAEFLEIAKKLPVKTFTESYRLSEINEAFHQMQTGKVRASCVIRFP